MMYSLYYQAYVTREKCWILTSTLKFTEHVAFDRSVDKKTSLFEFFVAPDFQDVFLDIMEKLEKKGIVSEVKQLPNVFLSKN